MYERQIRIAADGHLKDNVEESIDILRRFQPPEGYYLAFSGGKDSQCVYHLAKMAGVKFDAHYSVTSVDPPELVRFIKANYPDVSIDIPHDADGKPITMWNLIPKKRMPPTRVVRYCCEKLKESNGKYRVTLTGVRRAESVNRAKNQGLISIHTTKKALRRQLEDSNIEYHDSKNGGLILNYDNEDTRDIVEMCYRTTKTIINPIISWTEDEVWEFLNSQHIPHCSLYDEGFRRIGCIGCPMNTRAAEEFERWPKYRAMYIRAFERMLASNKKAGIQLRLSLQTGEEVMKWWLMK